MLQTPLRYCTMWKFNSKFACSLLLFLLLHLVEGLLAEATDKVPFDFSLFHEDGQQKFGPLSVNLNATRAVLADPGGVCPAPGKNGNQQLQQPHLGLDEVHLEFCMKMQSHDCITSVPERLKGLPFEGKYGLLFCYTGRLDPAYGKLYGRPVETRHQVPNVGDLKMTEACKKLFPGVMYSPWHSLFVEFMGVDAESKTVKFLLLSSISRKNHTIKLGWSGEIEDIKKQKELCFSIRLGPQLVTEIFVLTDDEPGEHGLPGQKLLAVEPPILEKDVRANLSRYLLNGGFLKKVAGLWLLGLDMLRGLDDRNWVYLAGTPTAEGKSCLSAKIRVPFDGQRKFANCKSWWAPVKAALVTEMLDAEKKGTAGGSGVESKLDLYYVVRAGYVEGKKGKRVGWEEDKNLKVLVEYVKTIVPLLTGQMVNGPFTAEDEPSWVETVEKTGLALQDTSSSYGHFFYVQLPTYWKELDDQLLDDHEKGKTKSPKPKDGDEEPEDNTGEKDYFVDMLLHQCGETPVFASFAQQQKILPIFTGKPDFDWSEDFTFLEGCSLKFEDRTPTLPHHIGSKVFLFEMGLGYQGHAQQFDEVRQLATKFKFGLTEGVYQLRDFYKQQEDGEGLGKPNNVDPCFGHYKRTGQKVDKTLVEDPLISFAPHRIVHRAFHQQSQTHFKQVRVRQQYFECQGQGQLDGSKFWLPFVCVLEQKEKDGWQPNDAALVVDCEKCLGRAQCSCTIF